MLYFFFFFLSVTYRIYLVLVSKIYLFILKHKEFLKYQINAVAFCVKFTHVSSVLQEKLYSIFFTEKKRVIMFWQ